MTEPNTEASGPLLTPADLANFATIPTAKAAVMIEDALAMAAVVAPCIKDPAFEHRAVAKAIVRGAVLRWHEAGTGAVVTQSTMSYGQTIDTRQPRRGMFLRSEVDDLRKLCRPDDEDAGGAFAIDLFPPAGPRLSAREEFARPRHHLVIPHAGGSTGVRSASWSWPSPSAWVRRTGPARLHAWRVTSKRAEYMYALYSGSLAEPGDPNPYAGGESLVLPKLWMRGYMRMLRVRVETGPAMQRYLAARADAASRLN